jgi:protein-tyrosine phosphatase
VDGVPSLIECLLPARVFLSGITFADAAIASQLRLSRIINVTPQAPACPDITACFPVEDSDAADIGPVLEQTRPIISACAQGDLPILVHCHQGVSRSASVVIDYVASVKQISADEAMERIRCSRSIVQPNEAFMAQLRRMHPAT